MKTISRKDLNAELKALRKKLFFGIFEIIDKMHKHSIEDYKHVIDGYLTEEDDEQIKSDIEFEKIYSEQFHSMFEHIAEEFQWRLKDLKVELMKRLDIKPRIINKLNVIQEENESDSESSDDSENELETDPKKFMEKLTKFNPNLAFDVKSGKIINLKSDKKLQTKDTITEEKNNTEDKND